MAQSETPRTHEGLTRAEVDDIDAPPKIDPFANVSLASITGIQYQAQELSGIDDTVPDNLITPKVIDSYPSVPALRVNVPEIQDGKATFKYNFFVPNEREITDNSNDIINVSVSTSDEIFFSNKQ